MHINNYNNYYYQQILSFKIIYNTFLVHVILGTGFPSASQFNLIIESFLVSIFPPDVTDLIRDGTVT